MQNDGSETAELFHSNIFEIASLRAELKLAKAMSVDSGNQLSQSFVLLAECRAMLEIAMVKVPQLHNSIQELIVRVDEFYPQPVSERY